MVTREDLLKGANETANNPNIKIKALFDSAGQEINSLEAVQKKILFLSGRLNSTVETILSSKTEAAISSNMNLFNENKIKIDEHISDIQNERMPNINKKLEEMGKLIEKHTELSYMEENVTKQFHKISECELFIDKATTFLIECKSKISKYNNFNS